jgi:hypothetical protein
VDYPLAASWPTFTKHSTAIVGERFARRLAELGYRPRHIVGCGRERWEVDL